MINSFPFIFHSHICGRKELFNTQTHSTTRSSCCMSTGWKSPMFPRDKKKNTSDTTCTTITSVSVDIEDVHVGVGTTWEMLQHFLPVNNANLKTCSFTRLNREKKTNTISKKLFITLFYHYLLYLYSILHVRAATTGPFKEKQTCG